MKERWKRQRLKVTVRIAHITIASKTIVAHANKTIVAHALKMIASKTIAARAHKVASKVVNKVASQAHNKVSHRVRVSTTTQQIAIAIATVVVVKDVVTMKAHRAPIVTKSMLMFQKIQ
jgi:hypothetical protein